MNNYLWIIYNIISHIDNNNNNMDNTNSNNTSNTNDNCNDNDKHNIVFKFGTLGHVMWIPICSLSNHVKPFLLRGPCLTIEPIG